MPDNAAIAAVGGQQAAQPAAQEQGVSFSLTSFIAPC